MTVEYVIKRNGEKEPFSAEKLNKWAEYATKTGGKWSEISLLTYKRLPSEVKSEDIHQTMINVCLDKKDIVYSRIAARLEHAKIRKTLDSFGVSDRGTFKDIFNFLCEKGIWDKTSLPEYDPQWEDWYKELYQNKLEFWQIKQWSDKYALKYQRKVIETPHIGALGIGLGFHGNTELAFKLAKGILEGKINLPTPALNGIRNGDFNSISCCVITGGDSVGSIETAQHLASTMTSMKSGIGLEFDTRSKGDPVKNGAVEHLGKHSLYAHTDTGVKQFTQVTRGGSATVTFKCIDPEASSICLWKTQRVDIETRLDKLDYSMAYNNAFLEAVVKNEDWYLFSLIKAPEAHDIFYKPETTLEDYKKLAEVYEHTKIKARDLLKTFLTSRGETGRVYCFNVSRANEHTPFKDEIRLSNLCVAPETQILTKEGYKIISELEGEKVDIWNGQQWSNVDVVKTGENQKLLKVVTSAGQELECTPYHKWYVFNGYHKPCIVKRTHELVEGDKLIKFDLPVIGGGRLLENAYENGFYTADGTCEEGRKKIYFYHEKRKLVPFFDLKKHTIQEDLNREYGYMNQLKDKFFVPVEGYSIESRLKWLAGWLDGDGSVYRNGTNQQLVGSSVEYNFLKEVQHMLQTLGVSSKIRQMADEGFRKLPKNDGSGELGDYWCQDSYRLLITSCDVYRLVTLGLQKYLNRLKVKTHLPQRDAKQFNKVVSVLDEGRVDDTYCFTESLRGMGMFNGILTGQCQEICLPTKPYENMVDLYSENESKGEVAFCTLSALNVGNISKHEYEDIAETTLRTVDVMIDKATMLSPSLDKMFKQRRSVGIGITGLAGWMYNKGLDYDGSDESLSEVSKLSELHYYSLLKASQNMAKESGFEIKGVDLDWLPIDTKINKRNPELDWESLRGKQRKHSVLVAHMPTTSSSVFSNATSGLYPVRNKVINNKSRKGVVQYVCDSFIEGVHKTAWHVDNITLSKYYSELQDYTDQGISADYYFDPSQYEDEKKPLSELMKEWVIQAKLGNKSMYYINTRDYNGGSMQDTLKSGVETVTEDEGCESGGCKL